MFCSVIVICTLLIGTPFRYLSLVLNLISLLIPDGMSLVGYFFSFVLRTLLHNGGDDGVLECESWR
jgi:hypothetical protein